MTGAAAVNGISLNVTRQPSPWRRRFSYWLLTFLTVFVICFYFARPLFEFLVQPIADVMLADGNAGNSQRMIFTALTEVFFTYVKVALFAAAFICFPVFLSVLWWAKLAGRGVRRKWAGACGWTSLILAFFLGGALVYAFIYPKLLGIWFAFQVKPAAGALPIELEQTVNELLSQLMHWMFVGGLVLLLPVALFLWIRAGRAASPKKMSDAFK
ncbi:MAG: hypothetical protein Kow00114_26230 [Kiloniellaceae bacterium]